MSLNNREVLGQIFPRTSHFVVDAVNRGTKHCRGATRIRGLFIKSCVFPHAGQICLARKSVRTIFPHVKKDWDRFLLRGQILPVVNGDRKKNSSSLVQFLRWKGLQSASHWVCEMKVTCNLFLCQLGLLLLCLKIKQERVQVLYCNEGFSVPFWAENANQQPQLKSQVRDRANSFPSYHIDFKSDRFQLELPSAQSRFIEQWLQNKLLCWFTFGK